MNFTDSPGIPPSANAHELFRGFSFVAPCLLEDKNSLGESKPSYSLHSSNSMHPSHSSHSSHHSYDFIKVCTCNVIVTLIVNLSFLCLYHTHLWLIHPSLILIVWVSAVSRNMARTFAWSNMLEISFLMLRILLTFKHVACFPPRTQSFCNFITELGNEKIMKYFNFILFLI